MLVLSPETEVIVFVLHELPSSRYAELEVSDASFELLTFSHPKRD
jgi:hypothetical protein